jgi:hypothetical protein
VKSFYIGDNMLNEKEKNEKINSLISLIENRIVWNKTHNEKISIGDLEYIIYKLKEV